MCEMDREAIVSKILAESLLGEDEVEMIERINVDATMFMDSYLEAFPRTPTLRSDSKIDNLWDKAERGLLEKDEFDEFIKLIGKNLDTMIRMCSTSVNLAKRLRSQLKQYDA